MKDEAAEAVAVAQKTDAVDAGTAHAAAARNKADEDSAVDDDQEQPNGEHRVKRGEQNGTTGTHDEETHRKNQESGGQVQPKDQQHQGEDGTGGDRNHYPMQMMAPGPPPGPPGAYPPMPMSPSHYHHYYGGPGGYYPPMYRKLLIVSSVRSVQVVLQLK